MTEDTADIGDAASPAKVERLAAEFDAKGRPYARVTVVRREPPVSANVGDRALVTPDGDLVGWVGGADCAKSVVEDVATDALANGQPVLVGLAPDPADVDRPGLEAYPMTCHSGGTLEVFVEPVTPVPQLVVVGESPIARALATLADHLTYEMTVVTDDPVEAGDVPGADRTVAATDAETVAAAIEGAEYVVVASMGEYDDLGVLAGLQADTSYLALVASDKRRDELATRVAQRLGLATETVVDAVTTAAGLELGAQTPEEIAVSILAELVGVRRDIEGPVAFDAADASVDLGRTGAPLEATGENENDRSHGDSHDHGDHDHGDSHDHDDHDHGDHDHGDHDHGDSDDTGETVLDPVCGMDVTVGEAAATVERDGEVYHFCGQGCADAFTNDPGRYLDTEMAANG